jgi:hypothetical protein
MMQSAAHNESNNSEEKDENEREEHGLMRIRAIPFGGLNAAEAGCQCRSPAGECQ